MDYEWETQPPYVAQNEYLINGKLKTWRGLHQEVYTPITPTAEAGPAIKLGHYPLMSSDAALEVLKCATQAYALGQGNWPSMHPLERIKSVREFLALMKTKRNEVVHLLQWEIGKRLLDAMSEFDRTVEYIQKTIAFYERKVLRLQEFKSAQGFTTQLQFSPRGITLCMGPYNYPLNETLTTIIPALITGNVVIFKPPRLGVLLHRPLLQAFATAFPPGVVNTIYGEGQKVVAPLMQSGKIDVLAFIGSSKVADVIRSAHPYPHRLHTILGLDAKNPGIIFRDADLKNTVKECIQGSLLFNGQRCTAIKIIFVERTVAVEFVKHFTAAVDELVVGAPWDEEVFVTPLPEESKINYLEELTQDAISRGAHQVNERGGLLAGTRYFPSVLYPVSLESRIAKEEQFGPVVPIVPFDRIDTVIDYIVKSPFGQQASLFTTSQETVFSMIGDLANQVSRININSACQRGPDELPFTGRKDSAQGILSIREALRAFSLPLVVAGKTTPLNHKLFKRTFDHEQVNMNRAFLNLKK